MRVSTPARWSGRSIVGVGRKCFVHHPTGKVEDHHRDLLVSGGDQLEEQVRCVLIERNVSDFVDDDQLVTTDFLESEFEFPTWCARSRCG